MLPGVLILLFVILLCCFLFTTCTVIVIKKPCNFALVICVLTAELDSSDYVQEMLCLTQRSGHFEQSPQEFYDFVSLNATPGTLSLLDLVEKLAVKKYLYCYFAACFCNNSNFFKNTNKKVYQLF